MNGNCFRGYSVDWAMPKKKLSKEKPSPETAATVSEKKPPGISSLDLIKKVDEINSRKKKKAK